MWSSILVLCHLSSSHHTIMALAALSSHQIYSLQISHELAKASQDVDLVILEGMGRSIETNLNAELTCDRLNLGMIKHPEVGICLDTVTPRSTTSYWQINCTVYDFSFITQLHCRGLAVLSWSHVVLMSQGNLAYKAWMKFGSGWDN